jgi:hypothetical protein
MPQLNFAPVAPIIAAGATYAPLVGWEYEYLPFPAHVRIICDATAAGIVATVKAGSETIVSECPVTSGGTVSVCRSEFAVTPIDFNAAAGDKLSMVFRNTTGGAQQVQGTIIVNPIA